MEVGDGDGLVAVGAGPSGPEAPAEQLAVVAAAGPEVAGLARWALVDGGVGAGGGRLGGCGGGCGGLATPLVCRRRSRNVAGRRERSSWRTRRRRSPSVS